VLDTWVSGKGASATERPTPRVGNRACVLGEVPGVRPSHESPQDLITGLWTPVIVLTTLHTGMQCCTEAGRTSWSNDQTMSEASESLKRNRVLHAGATLKHNSCCMTDKICVVRYRSCYSACPFVSNYIHTAFTTRCLANIFHYHAVVTSVSRGSGTVNDCIVRFMGHQLVVRTLLSSTRTSPNSPCHPFMIRGVQERRVSAEGYLRQWPSRAYTAVNHRQLHDCNNI
jgi:hypothetical protein